MVEEVFFSIRMFTPGLYRSIEQVNRAYHVGHDKFHGVFDAPIHVALCCEVHYAVHIIFGKQVANKLGITNIALNKHEIRLISYFLQIIEITSIGELIEHDDAIIGVSTYEVLYGVATDKSSSTGEEYVFFEGHLWCKLLFIFFTAEGAEGAELGVNYRKLRKCFQK